MSKTRISRSRYHRVRIRDPKRFINGTIRTHDIGRKGHTKRLAGQLKKSGKWATQAILLSKKDFTTTKNKIIPTNPKSKTWYTKGYKKQFTTPKPKGQDWKATPQK